MSQSAQPHFMLPTNYSSRSSRPVSETLRPTNYGSMESDLLGNWYEELQAYERSLDEMAATNLDQTFKEEMQHVDQWYRYLSEAERTAAIYTLLQHSSQVQIRFFINLLQQLMKRGSLHGLLHGGNPEQADIQSQLAKAELDASQRLLSVLPYKTGQVRSRPPTVNRARAMDRHSFALGDTEEYNQLFGRSDFAVRKTNSLVVDDAVNSRRMSRPQSMVVGGSTVNIPSTVINAPSINPSMNASNSTSNNAPSNTTASGRSEGSLFGRPRSVVENDPSIFSNWLSSPRRPVSGVGNIGDPKTPNQRPKSADISLWSPAPTPDRPFHSPWAITPMQFGPQPSTSSSSEIDFSQWSLDKTTSTPRRRIPRSSIPGTVQETDEKNLESAMQHITIQENKPKDSEKTAVEEHDESDHSEVSCLSHRRPSATPSTKKEDVLDMDLLNDVPAWFRSLRLHKYNAIFESMEWQDIIRLSDTDLQDKGVAALGARRKMLKVFETIRAQCDANHIDYGRTRNL
ncbi:hypothetical protein CLU79DRAFT_770738 [Phycomyces nitens]|nr:hypothetical protein CLU79DRAFT_770738 [Phycomyces nitens]